MASGILGDAISEVMQRIDSSPGLSGETEIRKHLTNFKEEVVKAEHNNETRNDEFQNWLAKAKDLVNDLIELTEDPNSLSRSESRPKWSRRIGLFAAADSLTPKIKEVTRRLSDHAEEYKSKFIQQSEGGNQNESDSTLTLISSFQQKRCFAYCSLFPKGYKFDVPQLINLWTAEGFLDQDPTSEGSSDQPEDRGKKFVRSFESTIFQDVEKDEIGRIRTCKLNPEKRDLATSIARYESMSVDSNVETVPKGLRHVSFVYGIDISGGIPDALFLHAKKLRTILLPASTQSRLPNEVKITTATCEAIFSCFKRLCVLDLHNLGIKILSPFISDLKFLKYLDLSENNIEKLPSSVTKLTNLQTLKLSRCLMLKELPNDLGDLKNLRHLEIEGCLYLTHMPTTIKRLTSLRTLSHFVVSNSDTGGLEDLAGLTDLRGDLEILHLEQLKSMPQEESFLKDKKLESLTLRWYQNYNDVKNKASQSKKDDEYPIPLQLPETLQALSIVGNPGGLSRDCFSSLTNLVKFSLYNCPHCEQIPGLPKLKILRLQRLQSLKYIHNHESTSSKELMESLEELTILDCPELTSWWDADNKETKFQKISKLEVQYCPNLTCLPINPDAVEKLVLVSSGEKPLENTIGKVNEEQRKRGGTSTEQTPLSKLKYLQIADVKVESPDVWIRNCTSLEELHIQECPLLKSLPNNLKNLERLTIAKCKQLELSNDAWSRLESLRRLILRRIPGLKSFPSELESLKCLEDLEIHSCRELTSLPSTIGKLTSLRKLVLSECNKLVSLPVEISKLKSLETLIIRDCLLLLPRYQRETGDDWHLIEKIKKLTLTQTSQGSTKTGSGYSKEEDDRV